MIETLDFVQKIEGLKLKEIYFVVTIMSDGVS